MEHFSHMDEAGNARMVDVGQKEITSREAVAAGRIYMSDTCFSMVQDGTMKKGDVLTVAQIAGIMGAKKNERSHSPVSYLGVDQVCRDFFPHTGGTRHRSPVPGPLPGPDGRRNGSAYRRLYCASYGI